jgi:CheY-like chemotaxis protein
MYNKEINLITLDLEMPIMDGLLAIQEIRKFNKDVIIII